MTRTKTIPSLPGHTPGPWEYDMDFIVAPDLYGRHAAQELLAACRWMMQELCQAWNEPEHTAISENFRIAIAKANAIQQPTRERTLP